MKLCVLWPNEVYCKNSNRSVSTAFTRSYLSNRCYDDIQIWNVLSSHNQLIEGNREGIFPAQIFFTFITELKINLVDPIRTFDGFIFQYLHFLASRSEGITKDVIG